MGGGSSKSQKESSTTTTTTNSGIPAKKRYDTTYLTGLLLVALAEKQQSTQDAKNKSDHIRMAIEACDVLQNLSDSYAYSEEAIASGSIAALVHLTKFREGAESPKEQSQQDVVERHCPDCTCNCTCNGNCNCSQELKLALACAHTLQYMLEESSAPLLFREALVPLLPERSHAQGTINAKINGCEHQEKWCKTCCNIADVEILHKCLEKISVLILASSDEP